MDNDEVIFYKLTKLILSHKFKYKTKLQKALIIILEHINCKRGSIMLYTDNHLEIIASTNENLIGIKVPLEKDTPSVRVFKNGEILNTRAENNLERYNQHFTYLIVPIKVKDQIYGVFNFTGKKEDSYFTDKEIKIISKFIKNISMLIENLYLTENLKKERKELSKALNNLKETQKLQEELTHMIIHDLKSPISQIMANLDILEKDVTIKEKYFDVLDTAIKGCDDIMRMVQNLIDIYKFEQNKFILEKEVANINDLIKEVANSLYSLISEKKQKIYLKLDANIQDTLFDIMLMKRVFYNLLHNAIKYSPENEKIFIKTKLNKDVILINIKNTGVSIPKEHRKKIFEKFFSLYRKQDNSGLGLTFVKLAIESHNGNITLSSREGKWTNFKISLPVEKELAPSNEILNLEL